MARRSIETIQREAKANDQVKIRPSATRQYSGRYSNRIGMVVRKSTDKKTNQKVCAVRFPNRASELMVNLNDLVVVRIKQ
jgi:hypothetical protein